MTYWRVAQRARAFLSDNSGATAIEYALIAGSISILIVTLALQTGETVQDKFQAVVDGFSGLN
ncbi:pilus assembly protein Flp/PilA [Tepidamorphus gemmatus]|uniref:Pilus assembly protein Flp/PilA n=1 Tax=Tepidamorphus gemmatus TaxID=747076 RepID=A0A4R3LZY4_9HYPH|nr:Flp family type IVb pilin [Tepidamorphus gemmatus]TCT05886.1 pilus assembly protein Flp/PilA [Tepidamorphus gemmatus]